LDFARDNLAGNGGGADWVVRNAELGAAQGDAGVSHAGDTGLQVAVFGQEIDGDTMLTAKVHHGRTDAGSAEDADRLQMVDRDG